MDLVLKSLVIPNSELSDEMCSDQFLFTTPAKSASCVGSIRTGDRTDVASSAASWLERWHLTTQLGFMEAVKVGPRAWFPADG
jgi:hypothetical protein